jgi:hypothetical protein
MSRECRRCTLRPMRLHNNNTMPTTNNCNKMRAPDVAAAGVTSLQGVGASMSMCSSCSWIVHRSGGGSATGGSVDGVGGGGNSGCDVVAAVFGLASGVCSVMTLLLPIPYDRAPQVPAAA